MQANGAEMFALAAGHQQSKERQGLRSAISDLAYAAFQHIADAEFGG
jgi:hypothetical protein